MKNNIIKKTICGLITAATLVTGLSFNPVDVRACDLCPDENEYENYAFVKNFKILSVNRTGLTTAKVTVTLPDIENIKLISKLSQAKDPNQDYLFNKIEYTLTSTDNVDKKVSVNVSTGYVSESKKVSNGNLEGYSICNKKIYKAKVKQVNGNTFTFTVKHSALKRYKNIQVSAYFTGYCPVYGEGTNTRVLGTDVAYGDVKSDTKKYKCTKTLVEKKHKGTINYTRFSCNTCGATYKYDYLLGRHLCENAFKGHHGSTVTWDSRRGTIPASYKYTWKKR